MTRRVHPVVAIGFAALVAWSLLVPFAGEAQWGSTRFYKRATCKKPSPESVKAWSGCWKSGQAWDSPTAENLFVRWEITQQQVKIWRGDPSETEAMLLNEPYFCTVDGHHTLAPERGVDFSKSYTMVFQMHDKPIKEWVDIIQERVDPKEAAELLQSAEEFVQRGGKYIRAWIVMDRRAGWDDDAEEDFWMLPIACEEIEQTKPGDRSQPNPR